MIKGETGYLDDLAKRYVCKDDEGCLVVAWHAEENSYVLRCGKGHYPDEIIRRPTLTEAFKQGEPVPEPIATNIKKRIAKRDGVPSPSQESLDMALIPKTDLGDGKQLTPAQTQALISYAYRYELDPHRGHVVVMYGKPYVTIDGYLWHAHQTNVPYKLSARPLNDDERKTYLIPEGAHAWVAECIKVLSGSSFTGLGVVTKEEMEAKSERNPAHLRSPVVAAHPWLLAAKRAE